MSIVNEIFAEYDREAADYVNPDKAKKAIEKYTKIIKENKYFFDAYILRGIVNFHLSMAIDDDYFHQALDDFEKAAEIAQIISSSYLEAIALYWVGTWKEEMENYEEAIKNYTNAIELEPTFIKAYGSRGDCYSLLDMNEEAAADDDKWEELREAQNDQSE